MENADLSAQRTLEEILQLAFSDIGESFDAMGNLLSLAASHDVRPAVVAVEAGLGHQHADGAGHGGHGAPVMRRVSP